MQTKMQLQAVTLRRDHADVDDEGVLVLRITVACDVCGTEEIIVAGHHVRALQNLLQQVIDHVHPALVDGGEMQTSVRQTYEIRPSNN